MTDPTSTQFLERIGSLERKVRRLALGTALLSILVLAFSVSAIVRAHREIQAGGTLTVRKLAVADNKGTDRILLDVSGTGPEIKYFDGDGKGVLADLSGGSDGVTLALTHGLGTGKPAIAIIGAGQTGSSLELEGRGPVGGNGNGLVRLSSRGRVANLDMWSGGDMSERLDLEATEVGPNIRLADTAGYSATLGTEALVTQRTGEQHTTSAASLVLFGKDGKVLWSAP